MWFLLFPVLIYLVVKWLSTPEPKPIRQVYQVPGRWYPLKFAFFYLLLKFRKWKSSRGSARNQSDGAGYGSKSRTDISSMECMQPLAPNPKAIDAVFFQGSNQDGCYMVVASSRRPHRVINGLVYLRIPEIGLLESPKMPDTTLFGDKDAFGAEGIMIEPIEPMKAWSVSYKGLLKNHHNPSKTYEADINMVWQSDWGYFDFDTDMSPATFARTIAKEKWTREYFENLKNAHQTHYEQMGTLKGTALIDGKAYKLQFDCMRDHSYGERREWKLMHRYGFHVMALEDGTKLNVGVVSQPVTCSNLELGYVYFPNGKLIPVDEVHLKLWQFGEGGSPPVDYGFTFRAGNRTWDVQVKVLEAPVFYIGWEWECKLTERMCQYTVNGVKGWGISEWHYRHLGGRPKQYQERDPAWTHTIAKD